jgi:hypothetical protein
MSAALLPLIAALLVAAAPPTPEEETGCRPLPGADAVLSDARKRYIIMGERHGTVDAPALFSRLVCLASEQGPVVVGLEMEEDQQSSISDYLASDGSTRAREALLANRHWRLEDGRASAAMLALLEELRLLRAAGGQIEMLAFMRLAATPEARESAMTAVWKDALRERPQARLLALIGRVHAETQTIGPIPSAASGLPEQERLTLADVPFPGGVIKDGSYRISSSTRPEWRWPRYDFYYGVGRPAQPSPNARQQVAGAGGTVP